MKDNRNMIKTKGVNLLLSKSVETDILDRMSDMFADYEPEATIEITDAIISDVVDEFRNVNKDIIEDLIWKYFLIGYDVGRATHSYKLEDDFFK